MQKGRRKANQNHFVWGIHTGTLMHSPVEWQTIAPWVTHETSYCGSPWRDQCKCGTGSTDLGVFPMHFLGKNRREKDLTRNGQFTSKKNIVGPKGKWKNQDIMCKVKRKKSKNIWWMEWIKKSQCGKIYRNIIVSIYLCNLLQGSSCCTLLASRRALLIRYFAFDA